jgi:hypothetical protein
MKHALVAALLLAASGAALAQFKCTGRDGKVAFQDAPCERTASGERLEMAKAAPDDGRQHVRAALARGRATVGMTRQELDRVLGTPAAVNRSWVGGSEHVQLVYRYAEKTIYFYLRDGVAESFSESESARRH